MGVSTSIIPTDEQLARLRLAFDRNPALVAADGHVEIDGFVFELDMEHTRKGMKVRVAVRVGDAHLNLAGHRLVAKHDDAEIWEIEFAFGHFFCPMHGLGSVTSLELV
jgi:hypothetical protein